MKFKKFLSSMVVLLIITSAIMSIAFAATVESNPKSYGPINGYSYVSYSRATNTNDTYIDSDTRVSSSSPAPVGYMGVKARLYKSTTLCKSSDTFYNDTVVSGLGANVGGGFSGCGSGTYNGKGITYAYNGNGYNSYDTNVTPNISFGSSPLVSNKNSSLYSMNESGMTFGSALFAESQEAEPDLIEAYGVDGTFGYVRSVDLNGEMPKTPQEAIEIQEQRKASVRQIPLYDVEGITVIGVFEISQADKITN